MCENKGNQWCTEEMGDPKDGASSMEYAVAVRQEKDGGPAVHSIISAWRDSGGTLARTCTDGLFTGTIPCGNSEREILQCARALAKKMLKNPRLLAGESIYDTEEEQSDAPSKSLSAAPVVVQTRSGHLRLAIANRNEDGSLRGICTESVLPFQGNTPKEFVQSAVDLVRKALACKRLYWRRGITGRV